MIRLWKSTRTTRKNKNIQFFVNNESANEIITKAINMIPLGTGYESMVLINNKTFSIIGPTFDKSERSVSLSKEMKELLQSEQYGCTIVHNHPNGCPFSLQDVLMFIFYKSLYLSVVIGEDLDHGIVRYYAMIKRDVDAEKLVKFAKMAAKICKKEGIRHSSYTKLQERFGVTLQELGIDCKVIVQEV